MYDEFERRNTVVIAVAQEDTDLKSHGKFLSNFEPEPRFEVVADVGRRKTKAYGRTTTYLIDKQGKVREIFPAMIHMRPTWQAVLHRIDELGLASDGD